ncbi:type IV toxin-antitoxin system AbiEi family antitoxin domain-containing protein [Nannocystis pusilla]|uniref:type IV toxin-antitoxin system AbiEi family antitoxin domain-containing protein n=1 Tax=Nannocystis pusilla TaxID=889268 RepID=UPI003B79D510
MSKLANFPSWDRLYEFASAQDGYFTLRQAGEAGYSPQLIADYLKDGKVTRPLRGVYRLVHFPPGENEDLAMWWLWSDQEGVFSHQTALSLHRLSDVLPAHIDVTLPPAWKRRKAPPGLVRHYGHVPEEERTWHGAVPVTSVIRTLRDCAMAALAPDLLRQAAVQALERGLVLRSEMGSVEAALRPYGGISP